MVNVDYCLVRCNRPRSIYQYSSMAPRLSGKNCKFFKFLLSLAVFHMTSLKTIDPVDILL